MTEHLSFLVVVLVSGIALLQVPHFWQFELILDIKGEYFPSRGVAISVPILRSHFLSHFEHQPHIVAYGQVFVELVIIVFLLYHLK